MSERGYLDDVPMRLNSKYYPQPRPQFKEIDIHIPIDALQDDYDFSLERSVLIEVSAWQEQKILSDKRKAEEAKRKAEEYERKRLEDEARWLEEEEKRKIDEERRKIEAEEQRRQNEEKRLLEEDERRKFELDEERRRVKAEEQERLEMERKTVEDQERRKLDEENKRKFEIEHQRKIEEEAQRKITTKASRINLSDFEPDSANPFDVAEMNSINSMAMLESVLQNNSSSVPGSQNIEYRSNPHITNTNYVNGGVPSLYCNQGPTQATSCFPSPYSHSVPSTYPFLQSNTNSYFSSPSTSHTLGNGTLHSDRVPTQMTDQSNIPTSTTNTFTNYFPFLTSMADSRSMRDRQNQYPNNLNQGYNSQSLPPSDISNNSAVIGSTENRNPFLNTSHPTQQFPVQGSLSHQSHYWPNGASTIHHNTYIVTDNPTPNGPLVNDPLYRSINSHSPSSTTNGTEQTLR